MAETAEARPQKTPGDLKRQEIARELGEGWDFFMNCPRVSSSDSKQGETLVNILRLLRERYLISDWKGNQPAFDEQGRRITQEAFYIQRTPKQQMYMKIPR